MKQNYNNESLAALGHGKWKSALRCTLLLIGLLTLGANSAWAQPDPSNPNIPAGLVMTKEYIPNDVNDGSSGVIRLETYVTGHSIAQHVPTDIVLVLDVSGSMNQNISGYAYPQRPSAAYTYTSYGNSSYYYLHTDGQYYRVRRDNSGYGSNARYWLYFTVSGTNWYLNDNVEGGATTTQSQAQVNNAGTTIWTGILYERGNTKMHALKASVAAFVDIIAEDATLYNVDHRISIVKYASNRYYNSNDYSTDPYNAANASNLDEGNNTFMDGYNTYNYTEVLINRRDPRTQAAYIKEQVNALNYGGATAADFGMNKARYLLASIPASEFEERSKVVVMFTDGEPTYGNSFTNSVANNTIDFAHDLKNSGTVSGTTYQFDATVFTVGVFGSNVNSQTPTYMNFTSSNYPDATSLSNGGTQASEAYYFEASSADGLSDIFESIAGASGAMSLPASTIVQDMVSPSFQLPAGASGTVLAYAPKFTGINAAGEYQFETINNNGTLTVDEETGVVTGGSENKLPSTFITVSGKTIQMDGFNFSEHWCGTIEDDNHQEVPNPKGRKIVILIPIEISDGSWGDGIATNDPAGSYIQTPDPNNQGQFIYYGPFNTPMANVIGSVWTEVVTTKPSTFKVKDSDGVIVTDIDNHENGDGEGLTAEIGTPEDLAWFISEVNGRIGYNVQEGQANTNTVASHPKLNGKLTADIDMSRHNWVPIGCGWQVEVDPNTGLTKFKKDNGQNVHMTYEGTFDGDGYVITGLKNNASKFYKQVVQNEGGVVVFPGMFSDVKGTVKNVFVLDADFRGKHHDEHFVHHGIIADTLEAGGMIFNCEAAGRITCNNDRPDLDQNLIYGGLVGLNQGTVHSCMAMAELTGYTLGGMIGENGQGTSTTASFSNGFTNGVYNYLGSDNAYKVGGIAGTNAGTIDNCYVRFERDNTNLDKATFGMLVGSGTAPTNSYIPQIKTWSRPNNNSTTVEVIMNNTIPNLPETIDDNPANSYTLSVNKTYYNMYTNDNMTGGEWDTFTSGSVTYNVYKNGTTLLTKLNANKGDGAAWKRTTAGAYDGAGDINDDYPVLAFLKFNETDIVTCLGSADGIRIDYATSLNEMLHRHNNGNLNENTQISNEFTTNNEDYYKVSGHAAITGGAINLYANDEVTAPTTGGSKDGVADNSTADGVVVYIDEDICLLQDATSNITAYTGQTLEAFGNTATTAGDRWHFISSSLANSEFGWAYNDENEVAPSEWSESWEQWAQDHPYTNSQGVQKPRDPKNPCLWNLNNHDEDQAFYPIDLSSYARADFYCFYEPQYHWINFRRNSKSHWHMDNPEQNIPYTNEKRFTKGKGYLSAVDMSTWWNFQLDGNTYPKHAQFIQNKGTLNNGNVTIAVTASAPAWTGLQGYNLLGNPYQSYLDFDAFVTENATLMANSKFANTYGVYDPNKSDYVQYLKGSSVGSETASKYINMHQGFFVQVNTGGDITFTNAMRTNETDSQTGFRGAQPAYPLVNFKLTDSQGNTDLAVLEVGRPENDGAKKLRMGSSTGRISLRYDNENCAILFRDMTEGSQPLYFDADEDGMFTLSWNTANADFRELTLVDNITGVRYDMLSHDSYVFEGHANDYKSRFKVVIGSFTSVEEEETVTNNFAFFDGSEWVVNGQGRLTVTDMMGRMVYSANLENDQNRVNLNGVAQGMYLMQVSNGNGTMVQKIVVR